MRSAQVLTFKQIQKAGNGIASSREKGQLQRPQCSTREVRSWWLITHISNWAQSKNAGRSNPVSETQNPSPFGDRFGKVVQPKFLGAQDGKNDHAVCCTYANIDLLFWPKAIGKLLKLENVNPQFSWYKLELIEFFRGSPLLASRKSRSARNFDFAACTSTYCTLPPSGSEINYCYSENLCSGFGLFYPKEITHISPRSIPKGLKVLRRTSHGVESKLGSNKCRAGWYKKNQKNHNRLWLHISLGFLFNFTLKGYLVFHSPPGSTSSMECGFHIFFRLSLFSGCMKGWGKADYFQILCTLSYWACAILRFDFHVATFSFYCSCR